MTLSAAPDKNQNSAFIVVFLFAAVES
ncbi:uncharacterized protein METZ01_LOCUS108974 [marine metagenome]|uniref:Uncharacterized protein n=1 Tax=marine metagenome TaxID=408172 RepID=A0A381WUH0_9ZZZZ